MSLIEIRDVHKWYGEFHVLKGISERVEKGEVLVICGPSGSGKSSLIRCLNRLEPIQKGDILFEGTSIYAPEVDVNALRAEVGMVFQQFNLYPHLTVLENVMIGRHCRTSAGIAGAVFQDSRTKAEEQATIDRSYELLREVGLNMHYQDEARNLPYGAQRRLEIARALATDPAVLLLDEPAAGMNPQETLELKSLILHLRKEFDLSILLIEHDMGMVMSLSDRIYVMEYGSRIAMGTPQEVRENPRVIKAYLGESDHA